MLKLNFTSSSVSASKIIIQIQHLLKLNNYTRQKQDNETANSNTTLVKVKLEIYYTKKLPVKKFKYNTC